MPSGLNATLRTRRGRSAGRRPVAVGCVPHPHRVVDPPEAIRVPSGLNATLSTAPLWPVSGSPTGLAGGRVPHSHRSVATAGGDPGAVGAERHTDHPVSVAGERLADRWPVAASHTRTVPSSLPEAIRVPSGLNATLAPRRCGRSAVCRRVGRWRRPTPAPFCRSCRRRSGAVGAERHTEHPAGVAGQRVADRVAGCRVPHPHRSVGTAGERCGCRRG